MMGGAGGGAAARARVVCGTRAGAARLAAGRGGAHRAGFAGDDAHDGGEALAAQRAAARLPPQHGRAPDAEPAVPALEEDGVGRPLHAHDAGAVDFGFGWGGFRLRAAHRIAAGGSGESWWSVLAGTSGWNGGGLH
jgi:hypothetical protein